MSDNVTGDCYEAAGSYIMWLGPGQFKAHTLVHGVVTGQGRLEGRRFDHAWVEVDNGTMALVVDRAQGKNLVLPRGDYYRVGRIDPDECTYYTPEEAMAEMVRTEHFGPWGEET